MAQKAIIEDLNGQKEEISQLQAFVSKYDLSALTKELENLKEGAGNEVSKVEVWARRLIDFFSEIKSEFMGNIQTSLNTLIQNKKEIEQITTDLRTKINLHKIELAERLKSYDGQFQESETAYNDLATQLNEIKAKMAEVREKHAKNVASFETHFAQNKAIWGELGKRHNLEHHLTSLMEDTEQNLKQFDLDIKGLLEKVDHLTVF
jgi:DNA repair exonuclease SbcCD ATPase subunit